VALLSLSLGDLAFAASTAKNTEAATPAAETPPAQTLIAFTFDVYGENNPFADALSALTKHGMPATIFLTTGSVGTDKGIPWDDVKAWIDAGNEVDSRADSNNALVPDTPEEEAAATDATAAPAPAEPALSDDAVRVQLLASAAKIARNTSVYPMAFSAPYGKTSSHVIDLGRPYYDMQVVTGDATGGDPKLGFNDLTKFTPNRVSRKMVVRNTDPAELCDDMAWATRGKNLLVIGFTTLVAKPSDKNTYYQVPMANLEQLLDCADALVKEGKIQVVTLGTALSRATLAPKVAEPPTPAPAPKG
jgi:peptidoglycan/xylan/chitin deacetylase (PgdA/CDA1 family)